MQPFPVSFFILNVSLWDFVITEVLVFQLILAGDWLSACTGNVIHNTYTTSRAKRLSDYGIAS